MSEHPTIVIESWGRRTAVVIVPRKVDKPSRTFRTSAEALTFADQLREQNGWHIRDSSA